ncbi:MAG: CarD family transcriptional regulator [Sulfurovaceae bacterium]|nr:CarD family transcriptional regulator [Sulfurovaceae bacterium]
MYSSAIYDFLISLPKRQNSPLVLLCNDDKEALQISHIAALAHIDAFVLPSLRISLGEDLRPYQEELGSLLVQLDSYYRSNNPKVLIVPARTLILPFPKQDYFDIFTIAFGDKVSSSAKEIFYSWGYHFVDIVTGKGEVSFRGDILDVYPLDADMPYRISLFGDEVESIRRFDVSTQKSNKDELEEIVIHPAFLALNSTQYEALKNRAQTVSYETFVKDIDSMGWWVLDDLGYKPLDVFQPIAMTHLDEEISLENIQIVSESKKYRDIEVTDINKLLATHKEKKITVIAKNESVVRGSMLDSFDGLNFVYQDGIINILSSDELIVSLNTPIKPKRVKKSILVLDELKPGEYVVHETHGVGLFKAIEKREVLGAVREFVVIAYQNEDLLLVPVENLDVIDRYVAEGGALPAIDRLGKMSFRNLKEKVREKLFAIASDIVNLSAKRHLSKGIKITLDGSLYADFMNKAGFIHTEDQEEAISSILAEMSSGQMMDRLLSADVGFGKTEVAMCAIFAVVKSGYQACMIAPTTLLSSQHFKSLKERLSPYGISVAKLDRFCTSKEKNATIKGLKEGVIDVVVGTHALLGAEFERLALVVIDEEHKFGVKQKESLKEMASNVHLLSMSATPIPRSLNLALSSVKTFSEILTPPLERVGVRTFVKSYDEKLLKEAFLREIRRGGQIFYVYNSIASIDSKKKELLNILPSLRIAVLHSQISAKETEDEMMKFEAGEYDVLLSTSIVESGIHMPHANTMIVDGAENFGMADLHQLRGRVGRGAKEGYCYFVVADKMRLTDLAKRRLLALESHSDLGSGAVLAFHDLEIRGGGNIIGEAQSGHIKQIGYGLYLRMLEEAIKQLSGIQQEKRKSVEVKLAVDAYLNEELISEDRLRLELYRRLALSENIGDVYEIASEIEDRFGRLDTMSRQFIDIMAIKLLASKKGISKVSSYGENVFIEFEDENKARLTLKSPSKDDDDIIATAFGYLR